MRGAGSSKLFSLITLLLVQYVSAQLSKEHYIPPIAAHGASNSNAFPRDQYIYISTPSVADVNYTITPIGSLPEDYILGVVSNSFPDVVPIGDGATSFAIANSPFYAGRVMDDKGYIIRANAPIYVALRLRADSRGGDSFPQAGALVSKGLSALGTSFRSGTFTSDNPGSDNNNANYLNFISLMATEDATQVTFDHLDKALSLVNISSPPGSGTFSLTVSLDRGETYLIAAEAEDAPANRDGLIGVSIKSDKPIAVNSGSANGSFHNGGGRDYGIDQLVGADKIGTEYIFVRGSGSDGWENILIVADQDNTEIFTDGGVTPIATLASAGDYYLIEGNYFRNAGSNNTLFVSTSKKTFVWQGIGSNSEANQAMFFVPPLSCGSQGRVDNIPQIDKIGTASFPGFVTVVTNQTASVTFSDANNTDKSLDDSSFMGGVSVTGPETVAGAQYKAYIIQNLTGNVSVNSSEELYCAYYNQNGAATSGGFYSGFLSPPETVIQSPRLNGEKCLPNVELRGLGLENYDSYTWFFDDGTGYVDLGSSDNPYTPTHPGFYKIKAQLSCDGLTSIAYSEPAVVSICPPDFDGDGINDNIDLDLDNDGIYNSYESMGIYQLDISDINNPLIVETVTITTAGAYTVSSVVAPNGSITQTAIGEITSSLAPGAQQNQMEWNFKEEINFKWIYKLDHKHDYLEEEFFVISTNNPNKSISLWNPNNHILVDSNYDNDYESGITLYSANEIRFRFNPSLTTPPIFSFLGENMQNIKLTHFNNSLTSTSVLKWDLFLNQNDLDTDGDGIPDAYDLDSDGDGCSDVIEAGFTDSDPFPDRRLGASPVSVSSLGLVAAPDGYTVPRDGDLSGVYDFQEVGVAPLASSITGQPVSQSLCLGETAHFEVETDLVQPVFQWQIWNGTDWVDINDSAIYSNTTSSNLSITPADNGLHNSQYRVTVSKGEYLCDPVISTTAQLTMVPPKSFSLTPALFSLSETDSPTSFWVALDAIPASDVVLDISNPDITEAVVSPTQLIFTPADWRVQQSVSIIPKTDDLLDGDQVIYPVVSINRALTQNCYAFAESQTVSLTILDINTAAIEIVVLDNLTSENGDTAFFTVQLLSKPQGIVSIDLSSTDLTEGNVSQTNIQFNPLNWNIPQTVVVTGLPDPIPFKDGNVAYQIITGNVSSTDADYNALDGSTVEDIHLINQDNSGPGIALTVVGGEATTDENGGFFVVQFHLLSQPFGGADVSFGLSVLGDSAEVSLSTTSLTILNSDWNKPFNNQIILTGLDDSLVDGDIFLVLETSDPTSADAVYDALDAFDIADLIFKNLDNDQPGFSIGSISNHLSEDENIATFSVVLDIKPNSDVFLEVASHPNTEVAVNPAFTRLHFTPLNWNIPQMVVVSGVDDLLIDGDQLTQISVSVDAASDPNFVTEPAQSIDVINRDNDMASILLSPLDLLTGESGETGSFLVRLSAQPDHPVQIVWASSNINEGILSSNVLNFSPSNWNQPQQITVNGVDDSVPISDGAVNYQIFINSIISSDPNFGSIIPASIPPIVMTNQDNDFAGITIHLEEEDFQTDENGDQLKVGFSLNTKPLNDADVTLSISLQENGDEMALLETEITIKSENWNDPFSNAIVLTGLDDVLLDGSQNVKLVTGDPRSLDSSYDQLTAASVADLILVNLDNDFPGIVLTGEVAAAIPAQSGAVTTSFNLLSPLHESGNSTTLFFQLNTPPTSDVTINVLVSDPTEVGIDKSFLIFTPENWNQPQTIRVTGSEDHLVDGDISSQLFFMIDPLTADLDYRSTDYITLSLITVDTDIDADGDDLHEKYDNCPEDFNPEQEDLDGDGIGDACDIDIDGDGVTNAQEAKDLTEPYDNCDFLNSSISLPITVDLDCDQDGVVDHIDLDDDNDGILDTEETEEDFDQNGRINRLDLDSDGDGCFDVIEAGFEDPDQDGLLGSSPVVVDALGRVISASGYTTPADHDSSGQSDYLELPQKPVIEQQPPTSVVVYPDQNIRLSIAISQPDQGEIQWQILQPPSTTWQNIPPSDSFRGVHTPTLILVDPQETWMSWKFRAAISSKAYRCDPLIFSQEIQLNYQPLRIPNAFSPNNDGQNENWIIEGLGQYPDHRLTVFSRWESVILQEAPYKNDWRGEMRAANSKVREVPEGTYFYILDLGNGQPSLKGFIYLKR